MKLEPFIEKTHNQKLGFNVGVILASKSLVKGDVGIEIEVEGKNLLYGATTPLPWVYKEDHSLRGDESGEYVLKAPISFSSVSKDLDTLFNALKSNGATFDNSNRTSVHVHLNCQSFHLNRLAALMELWFVFEEVLTEMCGDHRIGNLFCLRSRDATGIISHLRKFLKSDAKYELPDHLHYSGLNAHALRKYGSLEVRTLRGPTCYEDKQIILDWIEILQRLYEYSANYEDPRDVCGIFSGYGPVMMFNTVLGPKAATVRQYTKWTDEQISESMYRGIRLAQDLCYCRDWSLYRPQELKPDPFKRDIRKIAKKMLAAEGPAVTLNSFNGLGAGSIYNNTANPTINFNGEMYVHEASGFASTSLSEVQQFLADN